jgi:outer membrane protein assembly factor BamB
MLRNLSGVFLLLCWVAPLPAWSPLLTRPGEPPTVRFPVDEALAGRVREAAQLVQKQEWPEAVRALRAVLDAPDKGLCQTATVAPDGGITWISARAEAARLLGTLPAPVLADFKRLSEPASQELLRTARAKKDDATIYLELVSRYPGSEALFDAEAVLAGRSVEKGYYHSAAVWFAPIIDQATQIDRLSSLALYHATVAFCLSGDPDRAERAWKSLSARLGDKPVRVDGRLLRLDELKLDVAKAKKISPQSSTDWPLYRGDARRTATNRGGVPLLKPSWSVSTLPNPAEPYQGKTEHRAWIEVYLKHATEQIEKRDLPVLPAFHPIAVNGKILFRTYEGLFAVNLREKDPSPEARHLWQHTDGGVATILGEPNKKSTLDSWGLTYRDKGPYGVLFENSVNGTVVTDGSRAYEIDDLLLPPHPLLQFNFNFGMGVRPNYGHLNDQAYRSSLKVFDLESFKLLWEIGGRHNSFGNQALDELLGVIDKDGKPTTGQSHTSYFLGPPLPLSGNLYLLHELSNELRLLCVAPRDAPGQGVPTEPALVWSQTLLTTRDGIDQDFKRRIHAAHLAYSDGILVCPTNAGALVGVEAATQRVVWVYRYGVRSRAEADTAALVDEWKVSAPAIVHGKVIFTSPDSPALHCLDLRDGRLLWQVPRKADDCYFAGVLDGKVVIVSRNSVRALDLARGTVTWQRDDTGMPSGQGVAAGNVYYLPVKGTEPGIVALDLRDGTVIAQIKPAARDAVLGNLMFYEDQLLSQTITDVTSYPLVKARDK